ncbi:MAG: type II toxin-antitoxin system RelE/ParE family toxin [Candidatus Gracilibacteria bacterium]|nr:type II toxin-antitoxin system RelE/ParE family toxin [Candidatus Gracilibacteria bacterium]
MYKINYLAEARIEFKKLDKSIQEQVFKKLLKISENPEIGDNLSGNLAGYKKVYVYHKQIRIVYRIIEDKIEVLVIAIGKRENKKVYFDAFKRI